MTEESPSFDVASSHAVADRVDAKPKDCWRNALIAVLTLDDLSDAFYVEGVALYEDTGLPVAHGWIVDADGMIVDPTAVLLTEGRVRYFEEARYPAAKARRFVGKTLPVNTLMFDAWRAAYKAIGHDIG